MVFIDEHFYAALFPRDTKTKQKNNGRDLMRKTTLTELNEKFKDCPTRTAEYYINGKKFIVKSHFVGTKDLNKTLYDIAYKKAMSEMLSAS